jgi:uncharacterized protein (TIGR02453 family)
MDIIVPFLRDIHANDSREWYLANTDYYFKAFDRNAQYIQKLVGLIGKFDPTIAPLKLYQCSFALIRDQRIKIDQRNYNDFLSGSFTRGGKYSGYASYYYQISPEPSSSGGSFLAVGLYRPNKELLDCFRNTILEMGLEKFDELVKSTGFTPYKKDELKRIPIRVNVSRKYEDYLYMRHPILILPLELEWFYQEDWCERTADIFERCKPFVDFVNSVIDSYRSESPLPVGHGLRPIKKLERDYALAHADEILAKRRAAQGLDIEEEVCRLDEEE